MTIWNKYVQYKMIPSKVTFNRSSLIDSYTVPVCSYIHHRMGKCTDSYMCCYRSSYEVPIRLDMFLYVPVFFFGTAARGTLQDVKRERPKSRLGVV